MAKAKTKNTKNNAKNNTENNTNKQNESKKKIRLYRSKRDKIIGGVCGGIAEIYDFDPSAVRILAAAVTLVAPQLIVLYIIAMIVVPEK